MNSHQKPSQNMDETDVGVSRAAVFGKYVAVAEQVEAVEMHASNEGISGSISLTPVPNPHSSHCNRRPYYRT